MFSFLDNRFSRPSYNFTQKVQKMKKGELTLDEILSSDDIVQDLKTNPNSPFIYFCTNEILFQLIDYSIKMPKSNDHKIGYQFPFNATEILCSNTVTMQEKIMNEVKDEEIENNDSNHKDVNIENEKKIQNNKENEKIEINNKSTEDEKVKNNEKQEKENNNNQENNEKEKNEMTEIKEEKEKDGNKEKDKEKKKEKDKENNSNNSKQKKIIKYNIIDYLFEFLKESNTENNSNYVLVGYFNKILNNLIENQSEKIVNYIYNYPDKQNLDILYLLIKHMNRKGICEIVQKLLLCENQQIHDLVKNKIDFCQNILKELKDTEDNIKHDCICNTLSNALDNQSFFNFFMKNKNLVQMIFELLNNTNDINKDKNILDLHIKINENILKNFERRYTPDIYRENKNDFLKFIIGNDLNNSFDDEKIIIKKDIPMIKNILMILFNILEKNEFNFLNDLFENNDNEFISTYEQKQKKIGMKKVLQTEYIRSLLDLLVNSHASYFHRKEIDIIITLLNKKNIFWALHKIFFDFPFSNIFQIYYSQIIDIITNIYTPDSLVKHFFLGNNHKKLSSCIIEHILEKNEFHFNSKRKALNPCLVYEISILNQIINCNNDTVQNINKKDKDLLVFDEILSGDIDKILKMKLLYDENKENGFGDEPISDSNSFFFGNKNIFDIIDSRKKVYDIYKNGGDYKKALNEIKENEKKDKNDSENENDKLDDFGSDNLQEINLEDIEVIDEPIFEIKDVNKTEDVSQNKIKEEKNETKGNEEITDGNKSNKEIKDDDKQYNDCNFWNVAQLLSDKDINSILGDLE